MSESGINWNEKLLDVVAELPALREIMERVERRVERIENKMDAPIDPCPLHAELVAKIEGFKQSTGLGLKAITAIVTVVSLLTAALMKLIEKVG